MRVALVYDRVNKWGGAERILLALHEMFPKAPLYTAVYSPKKVPWAKVFPKVIPTYLNKIPYLRTRHEMLGTFTPLAFELFDFEDYDLVISVTSEAAKGVITRPPTRHICICLTPTRYLWSHHDYYFKNQLLKLVSRPAVAYLRLWDKIAAQRPDEIVAISSAVRKRIKKYYKRESKVIFPPVDLRLSRLPATSHQPPATSYYLVVSRLVSYKRVDLVVKAFNESGKGLVIVGRGAQAIQLKLKARKNIEFVEHLTDKELGVYYHNARALVMPQVEDFGIVAVEAQVQGTPVIAFERGGARDTVLNGKTGVLFENQTAESLNRAINRFEKLNFDRKRLVENARRFSEDKFKREITKLVHGK